MDGEEGRIFLVRVSYARICDSDWGLPRRENPQNTLAKLSFENFRDSQDLAAYKSHEAATVNIRFIQITFIVHIAQRQEGIDCKNLSL
jgi:hypothetical protein